MHPTAKKLNLIAAEVGQVVYERTDVIEGMMVALVGQQHVLMVGPPGCAKSVLASAVVAHVADGRLFSIALDEYTTADEVLGGLDVRELSTTGRQVRRTDGMLPTADVAFIDEAFNVNGPTAHSIHGALNERVFYQEGQPIDIPLRSAFLGTNKVDTDQEFAAVWDRIHLRYPVSYLKARNLRTAMISAALGRMVQSGRRVQVPARTQVTIAELDSAHRHAMSLTWTAAASGALLDIAEALSAEGIHLSDRRIVECAVAANASAFLHGHAEVELRDLSVLTAMAWNLLDQRRKATDIVLSITDETMKAALDLGDAFDEIRDQGRNSATLDQAKRAQLALKMMKDLSSLAKDVEAALARSEQGTDSRRRLEQLLTDARDYRLQIGAALTGQDPSALRLAQV